MPRGVVGIRRAVAAGRCCLDRATLTLTPDVGEGLATEFIRETNAPAEEAQSSKGVALGCKASPKGAGGGRCRQRSGAPRGRLASVARMSPGPVVGLAFGEALSLRGRGRDRAAEQGVVALLHPLLHARA